MPANSNELRRKIVSIKSQLGLLLETPCTDEECEQFSRLQRKKQQLPDDVVYRYDVSNTTSAPPTGVFYYRIRESDLTENETIEYLMCKQTVSLQKIEKYLKFFFGLTIVSIIVAFVIFLLGQNGLSRYY
jgi:hypothetical protein